MQGFEWAQANLRVETPHELQGKGVNVYFAPNIRPNAKIVNLANGLVATFQTDERCPEDGYYADYEGLVRYCDQNSLPFSETNGQISTLSTGFEEAGDPLRRGES